MFEALSALAQAWREIAHLSAITGLSVGLLAALIALVWFDPDLRGVAIKLGIAVAIAYGSVLFGYRLGAADVTAAWNAANLRAALEAKARDTAIAHELDTAFPPAPAATDEVTDDQKDTLAAVAAAAAAAHAGPCELGADALRLRQPKR